VAVVVDRPAGLAEKVPDQVATAVLDAAPVEAELVVLGSQVRVVEVDQVVQVRGVLGLEVFDRHFLRGDQGGVLGQGLGDRRVPQDDDVFQSIDVALAEQIPAADDLLHHLLEGDALPRVLAALACALEHLDEAVGVVRVWIPAWPLGHREPSTTAA